MALPLEFSVFSFTAVPPLIPLFSASLSSPVPQGSQLSAILALLAQLCSTLKSPSHLVPLTKAKPWDAHCLALPIPEHPQPRK